MNRISKKFQQLKTQNKTAFITYICAGDPNYETSLEILKNLPKNGADIIELGVPFLDPAGDGPIIENAAKRAIKNGASLKTTLKMVEEFRKTNDETPIILMTYYNPILKYGEKKLVEDATKSGADGLLIVDLPIEESAELIQIATQKLDLIQLIAPTTDEKRIEQICKKASGFIYLISMLGVTGTKSAETSSNEINIKKIRKYSNLPIAIGFGIKTPNQAAEFSKIGADGVIVGSAIVDVINQNLTDESDDKKRQDKTIQAVLRLAKDFSDKI